MKTTIKKELGLYDSTTGKSIKAYKTIDATHLCKSSRRCIIKYGRDHIGTIAQICNWYEPDKDLGNTIHYHVNLTHTTELSKDIVFVRHCNIMQVNPCVLAEFIYANYIKI